MAHGTCLTDAELCLLAERGTAIAHCPLSNFFFGDRLLQVKHALDLGVKVSSDNMTQRLGRQEDLVWLARLSHAAFAAVSMQLQKPVQETPYGSTSTSSFNKGNG